MTAAPGTIAPVSCRCGSNDDLQGPNCRHRRDGRRHHGIRHADFDGIARRDAGLAAAVIDIFGNTADEGIDRPGHLLGNLIDPVGHGAHLIRLDTRVFDGAGDRVEDCAPRSPKPLTVRLIEPAMLRVASSCMATAWASALARSAISPIVPAMPFRSSRRHRRSCSGYPQSAPRSPRSLQPSAPASAFTSAATTAKPRPALTGAGRLDGRVEREEIGLIRHLTDQRDDLADRLHTARELADRGRRRVGNGFRMRDLAGSGLRLVGNVADGSGQGLGGAADRLDVPIRLARGVSGFERLLRGRRH